MSSVTVTVVEREGLRMVGKVCGSEIIVELFDPAHPCTCRELTLTIDQATELIDLLGITQDKAMKWVPGHYVDG